jgi:hypothetical protein
MKTRPFLEAGKSTKIDESVTRGGADFALLTDRMRLCAKVRQMRIRVDDFAHLEFFAFGEKFEMSGSLRSHDPALSARNRTPTPSVATKADGQKIGSATARK